MFINKQYKVPKQKIGSKNKSGLVYGFIHPTKNALQQKQN